jgi:hypothetical protein
MKWTAWGVIRLLLVVAAPMAGGMALIAGISLKIHAFDKALDRSNSIKEVLEA